MEARGRRTETNRARQTKSRVYTRDEGSNRFKSLLSSEESIYWKKDRLYIQIINIGNSRTCELNYEIPNRINEAIAKQR